MVLPGLDENPTLFVLIQLLLQASTMICGLDLHRNVLLMPAGSILISGGFGIMQED